VITVDGVNAELELNVSAGQEEYNKVVEQILSFREVRLDRPPRAHTHARLARAETLPL
jgi:hypothetical protein